MDRLVHGAGKERGVVKMFDHIKIAWYGWVAIGFSMGTYTHCHIARHLINSLIVKILLGFVWILHRTDPRYQEPKTAKITKHFALADVRQSDKDFSHRGVNVSQEDADSMLNNPDVSVVK